MPHMLTVCKAMPSKSGKTLSILGHDDIWYSTKHFDLQQMVGQAILAETSTSEYNGKLMHWINEWHIPGAHVPETTKQVAHQATAPRAAPKPHPITIGTVGAPAHTLPKPSLVDRDASIVAQTLCKTVTFSNASDAWRTYVTLYGMYVDWRDGMATEDALAAENEAVQTQPPRDGESEYDTMAGPVFNDDIPF